MSFIISNSTRSRMITVAVLASSLMAIMKAL